MQEPTATGPNGEKIVFRGGQWQPLQDAPRPTANAPINTGESPQVTIARQRLAIDKEKNERERQESEEKAAKRGEAQSDAAATLRRTIEKIDSIKSDVKDSWTGIEGLGETGWLGALQAGVPGSAAYSLRKDLGTIDATQVLQTMSRLKELSPTGSTGFGALSEPELELLMSSVARLDPNMDQETFVNNLNTARKVYADMLAKIEGGNPEAPEDSSGWGKARVVE